MFRRIPALRNIASAFLLIAPVTLATSVQAADSYRTYSNSRFGFVVQYPSNLLQADSPPQNGDGRRFSSRNSDISLIAYGSYGGADLSLKQLYRQATQRLRRDKAHITYSKMGSDWFALSGDQGKNIFYQKVVLWEGAVIHMDWKYAASLKQRMDKPVARAAKSFAAKNFRSPGTSAEGISRPFR